MTEQESPYFGKHLTHSIQLQAFPPMKNGKLWGFLWTQIQGVLSTPPQKKKKKRVGQAQFPRDKQTLFSGENGLFSLFGFLHLRDMGL